MKKSEQVMGNVVFNDNDTQVALFRTVDWPGGSGTLEVVGYENLVFQIAMSPATTPEYSNIESPVVYPFFFPKGELTVEFNFEVDDLVTVIGAGSITLYK